MFTVGIDLGTTASVVACVKDGKPVTIKINGMTTTPSVVNYAQNATVVGREAIYKADCEHSVFSIKRSMGTRNKFLGRNPVEISADILSYLKKNAEDCLGNKVDAAVITVPAHFSDLQRTATKHASSIADIKVLRLMNEPTAAAIAFGLDKKSNGVFAVYDFGGGTFDFSVLRLTDGIFQVLATGGNNYLGGDDIDNAIFDYNLEILGLKSQEIDENGKIFGKLTAKLLKEQLGNQREVKRNCVYNNANYEFILSEDVLKKISHDFLQRSLEISHQVLLDSNINVAEINGIVMVGGMTRLQLIKEEVRRHFQVPIFDDINPEEAVALGAAIYADSISQKNNNMLLIDVVPLTLGIETFGGGVDKIIHRNTPVPIMEKREYTTYCDGQTGIKFHIVQGERPIASECRSIANFELTGIPYMSAGLPRVIVEFSVDVNGLLSVKAHEKRTQLEQKVVVDPSSGLSDEEMIAILEKALAHKKEDSIVEKNIIISTESKRMIEFWESIIGEIPRDLQKIAKEDIGHLKDALKNEQYQDVLVYKNKLEILFGQFLDDIISSHISGKIIDEIMMR
ncbi:MAG: Hsp70 family protein [Holosporaceae bacterium]|jgi:molecular chaperone HscA|nr:Hsp70 family protein [Holosporaceae bacterium]